MAAVFATGHFDSVLGGADKEILTGFPAHLPPKLADIKHVWNRDEKMVRFQSLSMFIH